VIAPGAIDIRPADARDQPAISALVRGAHLNPRDLTWRRFVVADDGGVVVGCAQVRVHGRGSRELASVVVAPTHRGAGIGSRLVEAILAGEQGVLHLFTEVGTVPYFERFGFRRAGDRPVPADLRTAVRVARLIGPLASLASRRRVRIVLMVRAGQTAGSPHATAPSPATAPQGPEPLT
jgi:N-acetylglutamate synthase-like GNAT family acetyltransferase